MAKRKAKPGKVKKGRRESAAVKAERKRQRSEAARRGWETRRAGSFAKLARHTEHGAPRVPFDFEVPGLFPSHVGGIVTGNSPEIEIKGTWERQTATGNSFYPYEVYEVYEV